MPGMRTYRELSRVPEFGALFATSSAHTLATTVSGLALGTLVYAATGSPLLSALSMFGASFAQVVGATALMSAADRLPPRAAMTVLAAAFGVGTAVMAVPGLPVAAVFVVLFVLGLVSSLAGGVRHGLLNEILPPRGYLLGRSVLNMSSGITQICGFAVGGLLVGALSPRGTLLAAALLDLLAAAIAFAGLSARPARATGRPSVAATWRINVRLWSSAPRRYVYLAMWVPNGLIVGCEALFVPYSPGTRACCSRWRRWGCWPGMCCWAGSSRCGGGSGWRPRCGCCWPCRTWCSCWSRRCRWRRRPSRSPRPGTRPACCCRSGWSR